MSTNPFDDENGTFYIEEHWTDMRPKSLIEQMERDEKPHAGG